MILPCQVGEIASSIIHCSEPADEYLLYGCLNQHTFETAMCKDHTYTWLSIQERYNHNCPAKDCDQLIAEWFAIEVNRLIFET